MKTFWILVVFVFGFCIFKVYYVINYFNYHGIILIGNQITYNYIVNYKNKKFPIGPFKCRIILKKKSSTPTVLKDQSGDSEN